MRKFSCKLLLTALLAASCAVPALADTQIVYKDAKTGQPVSAISIHDGKVRSEDFSHGSYTLFDMHEGTFTIIETDKKQYAVMDEAAMNRMADRVNSAMQQVEKQLAAMPPEKRAQMEKMMGGMMKTGREAVKVDIHRTGKKASYAGHACERVLLSIGDKPRSDMCVTPMKDFDIPAADQAAMQAMQKNLGRMTSKFSFMGDMSMDPEKLGGLPVWSRSGSESPRVLSAVTHKVAKDAFEIPAGFQRREFDKQ